MSTQSIKQVAFQVATPSTPSKLQQELTPTVVATELGLTNYEPLGRKRDLVGVLTQVRLPSGRLEPALLIANHRTPKERHVYIPLSQAWELVEPNVMVRCINARGGFAERLYGFVTKMDCHHVLDAIYEWLEDLVKARPPKWMTDKQQVDALLKDGWLTRRDGKALNS